jgi:hypothetical protein
MEPAPPCQAEFFGGFAGWIILRRDGPTAVTPIRPGWLFPNLPDNAGSDADLQSWKKDLTYCVLCTISQTNGM